MIEGLVAITLIFVGSVGLFVAFKKKARNQVDTKSYASGVASRQPTDRKDQLQGVVVNQTVTLLGEQERAIKAAVTLHEMIQRRKDFPWSRTGVEFKALRLAGDIWIFKIPIRESGKPKWFKATALDTSSLTSFYKGDESSPGPARVFKNNNQTMPVPYAFPKSTKLTPGITWEVVDIGTFKAEVSGRSDEMENNDLLYFVTSRELDGKRWLLYLDARKGEARGTGGLFLGEPFEPEVDVQDLL